MLATTRELCECVLPDDGHARPKHLYLGGFYFIIFQLRYRVIMNHFES
jgi:hypothetical protein